LYHGIATAHATNKSVHGLGRVFGDRIIISGFLFHMILTHAIGFYLWGMLKDKVCSSNPSTDENINESMLNVML